MTIPSDNVSLANLEPSNVVQGYGAFVDPKKAMGPVGYPPNPNNFFGGEVTYELPLPRRQIDKPYPDQTGLDNGCTGIYSTSQQMPGIICPIVNNNNSARGNEFALPYDPTQSFNSPKYNEPEKKDRHVRFDDNVYVVNDKDPFFPYPNFNYRNQPYYKTYPETGQFTPDGFPYYKYRVDGIVENFIPAQTKMSHFVIIVLIMILILVAFYKLA